MPGRANVIVLAEDGRAANLLRRYAMRALGVHSNRVRQLIAPCGMGDAKHNVLEQYATEVQNYRSGHASRYLIVHMDADRSPYADRQKQFGEILKNHGLAPRMQNERIAHVIMARHVETWLAALTGRMVTPTGIVLDEDFDCKRNHFPRDPDGLIRDAVTALYTFTRANAPVAPLPSIIAAVSELKRLEF